MIPTSIKFLGVLSLVLIHPGLGLAEDLQHDAQALQGAAKELAEQHADHVQVIALGLSRAQRPILGLRLTADQEPAEAQPAILLVAGLDGARAYTSWMAMDHARQLAEGYGSVPGITELLDTTTVYIIPRLDMDACEARSAFPLAVVSGTGLGLDNDRDGRLGEDGASDVNGDGVVSWMRQLDPEGEWIEDPSDARAMILADVKRGERGLWKLLREGLDSDGDEQVAEDPALDAVVNRNFPRNWTEHDPSAGRYPSSEPGALAMIEFMLARRDIALVLTYGEEANLSHEPATQDDKGTRGGEVKTGAYKSDGDLLLELGKRYRKITSNEQEGLGEQPGSFQSFAYHHRGLLSLDIDPWSVPLDAKLDKPQGDAGDAPEPEQAADDDADNDTDDDAGDAEHEQEEERKPGDDAKRLIWLDQNVPDAFLPWAAFEHPQLGPLEIGGFRPYAREEPPGELLESVTQQHFEFLLSLGAYLPRLELHEVEGKRLDSGLVEITAKLVNDAFLPQQTRAGERSRTIRPARVQLALPPGAELVGGSPQILVSNLARLGGRRELRWLVAGVNGTSNIRIEVSTDNAGMASAKVEIN